MNTTHRMGEPIATVKGTVSIVKKPTPEQMKAAIDTYNKRGNEVADSLNKYELPNEKAQAIVDHAIYLMTTQPQMKIARVVRKTVEYFKLQLKDA